MASVRKKGNVYYARFRLPGAAQPVEKSTGKTSLVEARERAEEMERLAKGLVSESKYAQRMEDLHSEATGIDRSLSVTALAELWLSNKLGDVETDTYTRYDKILEEWRGFLGASSEVSMQRVTIQDLESWKRSLVKFSKPSTVNFKIKVIRMFFLYAHQRGYIFSNPAVLLKIIDKSKRRSEGKEAFTVGQVKAVIDICDSNDLRWQATISLEEWKSMVIIGAYTAQRLGDVARLKWSMFSKNFTLLRLKTQKTGAYLYLPVVGAMKRHIDTLDKSGVYVHPAAAGVVSIDGKVGKLSNQFAKILEHAGLRESAKHVKSRNDGESTRVTNSLSFHSLRHTAVSMLHDAGVPRAVVLELVGHESEAVNQIYTHVGEEALIKAAESMPDILD